MREGLGERETLFVRRAKDWKERAADGVRVAFPIADRVERRAEAVLVVREDLIDAAGKIVERIAMRGKHPSDRHGAHRSQRIEKVTERVVSRIWVEPDVRG